MVWIMVAPLRIIENPERGLGCIRREMVKVADNDDLAYEIVKVKFLRLHVKVAVQLSWGEVTVSLNFMGSRGLPGSGKQQASLLYFLYFAQLTSCCQE